MTPQGRIKLNSNANLMTPNPSGGGAKAGTLSGRSWMFNIGTKIK